MKDNVYALSEHSVCQVNSVHFRLHVQLKMCKLPVPAGEIQQ